MAGLGRAYAATAQGLGVEFDLVFGPAYKGIPIATAMATALAEHHGQEVGLAYNRKETKDHGEGGQLVGAALEGQRVLLVDDVITAEQIREVLLRPRALSSWLCLRPWIARSAGQRGRVPRCRCSRRNSRFRSGRSSP